MVRATIGPAVYRLLLPLLLSLSLVPLVQAQQTPVLSCRLVPDAVPLAGESQFILELNNTAGLDDLAQLELEIQYNTSTGPGAIRWQEQASGGEGIFGQEPGTEYLLPLEFQEDATLVTSIKITATRRDSEPITADGGILMTGHVEATQQSSLATFTLPASGNILRDRDGEVIAVNIVPNCFLAIDNVELPTPTPTITETATPTETVQSPLESPTPTATNGITPTATATSPSPEATMAQATDTETPTVTPTDTVPVTPTPTATATVLILSTPTPQSAEFQSPMATPTPTATDTTLDPVTTPNIALTLTAEALETLLPVDPLLGTPAVGELLVTPQPDPPTSTPTATPTAIEVLSPPHIGETLLPSVVDQAAIADLAELDAGSGEMLLAAAQAAENREDASLSTLPVERIRQPAVAPSLARRPVLLIAGWTTFVAAVVLAFASWWIRRQS